MLNRIITYFSRNVTRMRYDQYLAAGYPIGSGVAEGACRHLVKDRLERTGMRWTVEGAQAILDLRSTYLNGDWSAYWSYYTDAEHQRLYGTLTFDPAVTYKATRSELQLRTYVKSERWDAFWKQYKQRWPAHHHLAA